MKSYQHLTKEERFYIHQAVREGKNQRKIATILDRHPSTISRELRRNMWPSAYLYTYEWAMWFVRARKRRVNTKKFKLMTPELEARVLQLLKQSLSPEQISGYLKQHHNESISHETIYRFIYSDADRKKELKPYLRQGAKPRRKRYGSGARVSLIPNRKPITERPMIVESKSRIGDWECDTVIGKDRKSVLVTLVERKTLFTLCSKVPRKTAADVRRAIIHLLQPYKDKVKTLTFDNGTEFVEHEKMAKALGAKTYFAAPYSSWQRGINENTNGLLRQFFPKGTSFKLLTAKDINIAVERLNNRPRKTRKYKTPNQMFKKIFNPLLDEDVALTT